MHTSHARLAKIASVLVAFLLVSSSRPSSAAAASLLLSSHADTIAVAPDPSPVDSPVDSLAGAEPGTADSVGVVARLLAANGAPHHRAAPTARAIMKYARQRSLDPLLIVGIIGVENAALVSRARSRVGAQGVMQVMPSWKRDIKECSGDLRDVYVNVCFGTRILQIALDASTSVREALLRYNGCVRTPGCHKYAAAVFSQAGRAVVLSRMETGSAAALLDVALAPGAARAAVSSRVPASSPGASAR